jgi:hypothetical protein
MSATSTNNLSVPVLPPMPRQAKTLWIRSRGNIIRNVSSIVFKDIARTTISSGTLLFP